MKSFWWSLVAFCILMFSCASKNVGKSVKIDEQISGEISYINNETKIDTSKVIRVDSLEQHIVIEEELTIIEYDKESGKPIKETNAKRKVRQDTNKASSEVENKGVTEVKNDSINHSASVDNKVESSETIETKSGSETFFGEFGKWCAICLVIGLLLLYLKLKRFN